MRPLDPTRPTETARQRAERLSVTTAELDAPSELNAALEAVAAAAPSDAGQAFEAVPAPRKKSKKAKAKR